MDAQQKSSSSVGLALVLMAVYLAFVVLIYVCQPILLALFGAALALIWLHAAVQRFTRNMVAPLIRHDS